MKRLDLSLPELLFVIVTRAALAAGVGLLLSDRLRRGKRRKVGLTLIAVGALTTLPAAMFVRQGFRREDQERQVA
jgi:hypothetical protein